MEVTLEVQPRTEKGKGPARRARAAGKVPAVFYGPSAAPQPVYVDARQMSHALHTEAGANVLINLKLDGKSHLAITREIQRHPIRGTLVHVDFVNVARDVKIHAEVPLHLVGESHGVKEGGQLDQHAHTLSVEALPAEIPSAIEVDVSGLGIGDSLTVADVKAPAGVEILNSLEDLVVAVHTETVLEVPEPEVEAEEEIEGVPEADAEAAGAEETGETSEG
jgi:large subunit ribosomal protein L25